MIYLDLQSQTSHYQQVQIVPWKSKTKASHLQKIFRSKTPHPRLWFNYLVAEKEFPKCGKSYEKTRNSYFFPQYSKASFFPSSCQSKNHYMHKRFFCKTIKTCCFRQNPIFPKIPNIFDFDIFNYLNNQFLHSSILQTIVLFSCIKVSTIFFRRRTLNSKW